MRRTIIAGLLAAAACLATAAGVQAQAVAPGIDAGRDCQTIRRCNFTKTGTYRGCISAYSCRTCKVERSTCDFAVGAAERRTCSKLNCTWGG
jgi:hypothetical protein